MNKFFSVFGIVSLVLLVVGGVAVGGYYLGQRGKKPTETQTTTGTSDLVTTTDQLTTTTDPTPKQTRQVTGGVDKNAGLVFDQYSLGVPNGWNVERETGPGTEKLIITKGAYELGIFQAATGGALCLYPGDPDFEGPSSRYTTFVELTTKDGRLLRRSGSDTPSLTGEVGFTLCQRNPEGDFNQPTLYGHASYSLPKNYDEATLAEMDTMVSSLKSL